MPTAFTPFKEFIGIAPETTPGTAVAMTATIPVRKMDFEDKIKQLDDPSLRGSMALLHGRYPGVKQSDFSFDGPVYVDTVVHLLESMLGDRTTTGAADPYTHAVALNNSASGQPKTHTLTWFTGITASVGARQYAGSCLSDLTITYDAEAKLVEYSAKGMGWGSVIPGAAPVSAPSVVPPFASWRAQLGIAGPASGGTLVTNVATASIELKRKLDAIYTFTNQQQPYVIQRGALNVQGKCSFIAVDESPLLAYLAGTQQQFQLKLDNGTVGAGQRGLIVNVNVAAWEKVKTNDGKTATQFDCQFDGISNSTDAGSTGGTSPCKLTVINGTSGSVY